MNARRQLTRLVKVIVTHALYWSGLLSLLQRLVMRRKAVVLMYHRVLTPAEQARTGSHPAIVVDSATFAMQMAVLKRRFKVLTLAEFVDLIERKAPLPSSSCVITFDDGWRDSLTNAVPILRAAGLPATVFLPVNYIGRRRLFVREALTHLLTRVIVDVRQRPDREARYRALLAPAGLAGILTIGPDEDARLHAIHALGTQPVMTSEAVEKLVDVLPKELGLVTEELPEAETDGFIDWDEARQMRTWVDFGAHGTEHRLLPRLRLDDANIEITQSQAVVCSQVAPPVLTFSYPNGHWTPAVANLVRDAGYKVAFTTDSGFVSGTDDPFSIRRLNIHQGLTDTAPMFLARVLGVL